MAWVRSGWATERMRRVVMVAVLLQTGCAAAPVETGAPDTRSGQVGVQEVTAGVPNEARLVLAQNETFELPLPAPDNALPAYPPALLARGLPPRAVCVQVGVGEDGSVVGTAPAPPSADCRVPDDDDAPFFAAAAAAAATWRFDPAFRCVFDHVPAPDEACGPAGTQEIPQAVSLVFRFVFEQVDGRGTVRVGE